MTTESRSDNVDFEQEIYTAAWRHCVEITLQKLANKKGYWFRRMERYLRRERGYIYAELYPLSEYLTHGITRLAPAGTIWLVPAGTFKGSLSHAHSIMGRHLTLQELLDLLPTSSDPPASEPTAPP